MSDTFFTASPHWTWYIIPYFFIGGIAGGAYFLAAILEWFGRAEDRPVIRTGYSLAFWGAILCGLLLTIDLGKPLRFWHMLFQSENFPRLMFKSWSPISFGAWAILLFGACAGLSLLGAWSEEGRVRAPAAQMLRGGTTLAKLVAAVGGLLGFFVAGYTGVLLSVTNRPIWADSPWLGALFLASGASTGMAAISLILFLTGGASGDGFGKIKKADRYSMLIELVVLAIFLGVLGSAARPITTGHMAPLFWGGLIGLGLVVPLALEFVGKRARVLTAVSAVLVLVGGFILRYVMLMSVQA